jgi:tRNA pseudouridine38-40 synthase
LGLSYRGNAYSGWQIQQAQPTVQFCLEFALSTFAASSVRTLCAGRTDAGVHGLNQVVHFDAPVERDMASWVRGTNRYLPRDIAVQWCQPVGDGFHARYSAQGRRYAYLLLESPVRPAIESGMVGWAFRPLNAGAMREAASFLLGEHDFSAFRSVQCQALTPVKTLRAITIRKLGSYWRFDFDGSAFLHHMVRNIMGCLLAVGTEKRSPVWMNEVLLSRARVNAAPTFAADGLYFSGPYYDVTWALPTHTCAMEWLPQ